MVIHLGFCDLQLAPWTQHSRASASYCSGSSLTPLRKFNDQEKPPGRAGHLVLLLLSRHRQRCCCCRHRRRWCHGFYRLRRTSNLLDDLNFPGISITHLTPCNFIFSPSFSSQLAAARVGMRMRMEETWLFNATLRRVFFPPHSLRVSPPRPVSSHSGEPRGNQPTDWISFIRSPLTLLQPGIPTCGLVFSLNCITLSASFSVRFQIWRRRLKFSPFPNDTVVKCLPVCFLFGCVYLKGIGVGQFFLYPFFHLEDQGLEKWRRKTEPTGERERKSSPRNIDKHFGESYDVKERGGQRQGFHSLWRGHFNCQNLHAHQHSNITKD